MAYSSIIEADEVTKTTELKNLVKFEMPERAHITSPTRCIVDGNIGSVIPNYGPCTDRAFDLIYDFPHYNDTISYMAVVEDELKQYIYTMLTSFLNTA